MNNGPLSLNIHAQGISANGYLDWLSYTKPRSALVIDEGKITTDLANRVPQTIFRFSSDDHVDERFPNARQFARDLDKSCDKRCLLHGGNEPGSSNLERLKNWSLDFVDECRLLKRKPVILNNFVFHPEQGEDGWKILKPAVQASHDAGGFTGVHIYWNVLIDDSEGAFEVLRQIRKVCGSHIRIIVTEYGCAVGYDAYKGYRTIYGPSEHNTEAMKGIDRYGDANTDFLYFVYGPWDRTDSFDVSIYPQSEIDRIKTFNEKEREMAPINPPTTGGVHGILAVVPAEFVNIRSQPNADTAVGKDIGDLYPDTPLTYYPDAVTNGYMYQVPDVPTAKLVAGWVSLQNGAVSFAMDQQPPIEEYLIYKKADIDAIRALLDKGVPSSSGGGF